MSDTIYNLNNDQKKWKIHAYNLTSMPNDDLYLTAQNGNNIYLDTSGGEVIVHEDLILNKDIRIKENLILAGNLQLSNPNARFPITASNFSIKKHHELTTNTTISAENWVNLTNNGYSASYSPTNENCNILFRAKVNFIVSQEVNELISFRLMRTISGESNVEELYIDSSLGTTMGVTSNGIYNAEFLDDSISTKEKVTYHLEYKISSNNAILNKESGVLGYDQINSNIFLLQELFIPDLTEGEGDIIFDNNNNILDASLNTLIEYTNTIINALDASLSVVTDLSFVVDSIKQQILSIQEDISNINASVDLMKTDISNVDASVDLIKTDISNIDASLDLMKTDFDTSINIINNSISNINVNILDLSLNKLDANDIVNLSENLNSLIDQQLINRNGQLMNLSLLNNNDINILNLQSKLNNLVNTLNSLLTLNINPNLL